jgi:hypothetical protein
LEVYCEVNTPWGDNYDTTTFEFGTRQQVIAKKIVRQYNDPRLALILVDFSTKSTMLPKGFVFWTLLLILCTFKSCASSENNINKFEGPT